MAEKGKQISVMDHFIVSRAAQLIRFRAKIQILFFLFSVLVPYAL
jgi:hypothetical protein